MNPNKSTRAYEKCWISRVQTENTAGGGRAQPALERSMFLCNTKRKKMSPRLFDASKMLARTNTRAGSSTKDGIWVNDVFVALGRRSLSHQSQGIDVHAAY